MPTALDRLLARPSALRALRSIVKAPELPTSCFPTFHCCKQVSRREHSCNSTSPPKSSTLGNQKEARPGQRVSGTRRKAFQIHAFDQASNSDDPGHPKDSKWLRIDNVEEPEKAALWAEVLQYRERVYGLHGIRDIWFSMARRGYNLPTTDTADATLLWATLIKVPQLVVPVLDHAALLHRGTGQICPRLYEVCMAHWLLRNSEMALEYHHRMVLKLRLKTLPLRRLAQLLKSRLTAKSLEAFMDVYRTSNERDIYDEIVPFLCDKGEVVDARRWHTMCLHRGDLPSSSVASHPIVQLFTAETSVIHMPNKRFVYPSAGGSTQARHPRFNEELMHRLLGRDTAPVRFEDSFCARMFATKAFPPESIVQGLALVGVNEIGPQALLAMCTRTEPLTDLPKRFKELKEAGITLQGCVFSLALEKFVIEGKFDLVRSILDSDQHPDVFGDAELQIKLLDFYLEQNDQIQAHRTLAILTLFHNDPSTESWNLVLQASIKKCRQRQIVKVIQDMRVNDIVFTKESLVSIKTILRRRQRGRKPGETTRGNFDDLRFVARLYVTILESGMAHIPPIAWREIVRRYGMLGRFRELTRLIFWLFCWYAPRNGSTFANLPKPSFLDSANEKLRVVFPDWRHHPILASWLSTEDITHPIRELFTPPFQQALIVWGFRAGLLPNAHLEQSMLSDTASKKHYRRRFLERGDIKRLHWSSGLRLLVQLRDLGVSVHRDTVTKALRMQFVNLFGWGRSLRKENRAMEDNSTIAYETFVREVNEIWGSPLFTEPSLFDQSRMSAMMWHPRLQRRMERRNRSPVGETLGKGWQRTGAETVALRAGNLERTPSAPRKATDAEAGLSKQNAISNMTSASSMSSIDKLLAASKMETIKKRRLR